MITNYLPIEIWRDRLMRKLLLLFALALLAGMAAMAQLPSATNSIPGDASSLVSPAAASNLPPSTLIGYVPDDKYKLRVGDRISFQIIEDRDAPKSLVVADSGEVDIPYLGRVSADGKTCKQLADELKVQLEKDFYYRATVIIALDVANRVLGRIYVWGQVHTQGAIEISVNENLTVGTAILRAGGFADFANKKRVKLIRSEGPDGSTKKTIELNMVEVLEDGKVEKDLPVQPNDFIIVPSRLINF
jgi:protein involved in polysaccharide export with SLBB domain